MLVQALQGLNFPAAGELDPQSLDWLFDIDAVRPMLEWMCQNVNQSNLLSEKAIEKYNYLCQSGETILKGRQLEEALSNLEFVGDDSVTEEDLKSEIEHITASLQHYKKQKSQLSQRRNLLQQHHTSLSHRLSKLGMVETKVKNDYKAALSQVHTDNTQMNESLDQLTTSVRELSRLYKTEPQDNCATSKVTQSVLPCTIIQSAVPSQSVSSSKFLSQVPIQLYYSAEDAFTTQLTAYTKKQFFQGIAEMASCGEDSRFEILEVSDPDSLLVRGENQDVNIRDCKELARLQALYIQGETERVKSLAELRKFKSQQHYVQGLLDSLKSGTFCTDKLQNKERLRKLQLSLQAVHQDFQTLGEHEVPKLIQESKEAKVLQVLTGDYNLKLARQDYFTSNQEKVINELIKQRSRNEFVTMSLEVELRQHRELHHILTSLYTQLYDQYVQYQGRLSVMSDSSLTSSRHKRETIDSRDKSAARLYYMLDEGDSSEKQLFLTFSSLIENAQHLSQNYASLISSLESKQSSNMDSIHALEENLHICEGLIYAGSSTTAGQPVLTPRPIQDSIIQLTDMLKQLEQGILDTVKDIDNKKKLLKNDLFLARERKLFTYFFTNPEKLKQMMDEISERLSAEKNMDKTE